MKPSISNDSNWGRVGVDFVGTAGLYLFCLYAFSGSMMECS